MNPLTDGFSNTWAEASIWADDINDPYPSTPFGEGHSLKRPVNPNGLFLTQPRQNQFDNIVTAMKRAETTLAYDDGTNSFAKATQMRLLLHWFGDLHQPLHNADFYNGSFLLGDDRGIHTMLNTTNILKDGFDMVDIAKFNGLHGIIDTGAFTFEGPKYSQFRRPLDKPK